MDQVTPRTEPKPLPTHKNGWLSAYRRFLWSSDESLKLKLAPLALLGVLPIDIVTNVIPFVGLIDDIGLVTLTVIVVVRTVSRVKRYR